MAIFEKKVIIGSVAGFIASAVGLIAVFFPSVFNLEKQSIKKYSIELKTQKDSKELYDILKNNSGKIIELEIFYTEKSPKTYTIYGVPTANNFVTNWDDEKKGVCGSIANNDGTLHIWSHCRRESYAGDLYRSKGGFGIWLDKETDYVTKGNSYEIGIPFEEDKDYVWSSIGGMETEPEEIKMKLTGIFFVTNAELKQAFMSSMFYEYYDVGQDIPPSATESFQLEPMNKKDLEFRKY